MSDTKTPTRRAGTWAVLLALFVMILATLAWAQQDASGHTSSTGSGSPHGAVGLDAGVFLPSPDASRLAPDARLAMRDAGVGLPDAHVPRDARRIPHDAGAGPADASVAPPDATQRPRRRPRDAGIDALVDASVAAAGADLWDAGIDGDGGVPSEALAPVELVDAGVPPPDAAEVMTPAEQVVAQENRAIDAPVVEAPPEGPPASAESTWFALKLIFGLAVLLALAYIGGHPKALRLQERLGIRGVILSGFPFVALGVIASLPSVGILTDDVIPKLRPVLQFGLGWIGFIIGAQLDIRVLDRVPRGSAYLILVEALVPFAIVALGCGAVMIGVFGLSLEDVTTWRDIVLLGAAAAMTAPRKFHGFANRSWFEGRGADALLGQLDEIVGVIGLLFIMAYFRNDTTSAWHLPRTAWLFVTVGLGVLIGVLIFATIRLPRSNAEFLATVLGAIAFASGMASVLWLSPVVICFIAGTLVTNFPNEQRENVFRILNRLERPIHLLFLMIAGALWSIFDWRGWALVPLFVASRIFGKWLGIGVMRASAGSMLPHELIENRRLVLPMSTLAIALVVSIERFRDIGLNWVLTTVIGGAVVTELLVSRDDEHGNDHDQERTLVQDLDDEEAA